MPTIGWFEILIIIAIAIIVLGPKDFPVMIKKVGSWIGTAKRYVNNIQNEVSSLEIEESNNIEEKKLDEKKQSLKRSKPLKVRLTDEEKDAHAAFIQQLGENAVWNKLKTKN